MIERKHDVKSKVFTSKKKKKESEINNIQLKGALSSI